MTEPMSSNLRLPLAIFVGLVLISSCKKDELRFKDLNANLNPEVGFPLVNATVTAEEAIESLDEDDLLEIGATGQISLIYTDSITELNLTDSLDIPNQSFKDSLQLSDSELNELNTIFTVTVTNSQIETFDLPEGDELDSLRINTGVLNISAVSEGNIPFSVIIKLLNGDGSVALQHSFSDKTPPFEIDESINFTNALFKFIDSDQNSNTFGFEYEVTYQTTTEVESAPSINFDVTLNDLEVHTVAGYLVPRTYNIDSLEINIGAFDKGFEGSFEISDPRLNIIVENGYGLNVLLDPLSIEALNINDEPFDIEENDIADLPVVQGANFLGETAVTNVFIDNDLIMSDNNISALISHEPTYIKTNLNISLNPDGDPSDRVFASILNEIDLTFQAEIPVFGSMSDFVLIDTANTDLGDFVKDVNENEEVDSLQFKIFIDNGLPVDLGCQVLFVDSTFNRIDSLFIEETFLIQSSIVNYNVPSSSPEYGQSIGKTSSYVEVGIDQSRIPPLEEAAYIIFRVFGGTTNNGAEPIRIFAQDELDFKISVKASLNIE